MGKRIVTKYTCDRCGRKIDRNVFHIGRFRFMHVFKWWVPEPVYDYRLVYICEDCFKSFKEWYKSNDTD